MNKYQKALNELKNSDIKLHIYNDQDNIIEEHQPTIYDFYHDEIFVLKELVEKVTPKKTIIDNNRPYLPVNVRLCPVCNAYVTIKDNYCHKCGQRLE